MQVGDYVISPNKPDRTLNFGIVESDFYVEPPEVIHRTRRRVRWIRTDVPRDDFSKGALHEIGSAVTLGSKTYTAGACDAADSTFTAVSGPTIEAIVIYRDTGVEGTSALIAYIDAATGLPITPNTGDIIVNWDNGANKIFKL